MRWALAGTFVVMALGCKREATATAAASSPGPAVAQPASQPAAQPPMPTVDAGPSPLEVVRLIHANCSTEFAGEDAGTRLADSDAAVDLRALRGRAVECASPDGGVIWRVAANSDRSLWGTQVLAKTYVAMQRARPARFRSELASLDAEAARGAEDWVVPGLLFRAPDRARGKYVRIEGVARDVREEGGETTLTVALDLIGRERIAISYPGIANDRVVNGAEVVVYGVAMGSHNVTSHRGDEVVPDVVALHVEPQAEGSAEEQTRRLLRRARHH